MERAARARRLGKLYESDPIEKLQIPHRVCAKLRREGIELVHDLLFRTDASLYRIPMFGRKSMAELKNALAEQGMILGGRVPEGWKLVRIDAGHDQ